MPDWKEVDGVAHAAGLLYVTTDTVGTDANTTKKTLASYTVAAGQLGAAGQELVIEAAGSVAANANTKTMAIEIGANSYAVNAVTTAPNNTFWWIRVKVARVTASTGKVMPNGRVGVTNQTTTLLAFPSIDFASTLLIAAVGTNGVATANDIQIGYFSVRYDP
jgi:hypothetical protein